MNLASSAKTNPKAYFGYVQSKKAIRVTVGDLKNTNGLEALTDKEKADVLVEHFEKVHRIDNGVAGIASNDIYRSDGTMTEIDVTVDDVEEAFVNLQPGKSPGPDGIHPEIVKPLSSILVAPLANLFRESYNSGALPEDWRTADVTAIHKESPREQPRNYRPISLTSILLKVMERIIRDKIGKHMTSNGILSAKQHGFVKYRSCQTNLILFLDEITHRLNLGEDVEVCYMDFRKAFDSVNHRLLLMKLHSFRPHPKTIEWIGSFLRG